MTFSNWSLWPSPFHLGLPVLLINLPLTIFLLFIVFVTALVLWVWTNRYKLKYLLRTSSLCYPILLLVRMMSPSFYPGVLDQLLSLLQKVIVGMTTLRTFWNNPLEITRIPLERPRQSRARIRKYGDPDTLPPVFANGWIPVLQSSDIPKLTVHSVSIVGKKLAVFRGESGEVFASDAYCPHLGADLGVNGRVEGDCIQCPFHGWRFRGQDGMCTHIPNSNSIPSTARVKNFPCIERNNYVYVWHHAEEEEPSWEVPALTNVESGRWTYRGKTEHTTFCHMQEIPENGADVAHLSQLHSRSVFSGGEWMSDPGWFSRIVDHKWTPDWRPDPEQPHVGRMSLTQHCYIFGVYLPFLTINMEIEQIGPAAVHMHLKTWFGEGVFLQHVIPEGPMRQRVVHLLYTERRFVQIVASLLIYAEAYMFDRDVAVWDHKQLLRSPLLVREDRLIVRYRRWYSQFYSPSSPTYREVMDRSLDW